MKDMEKVIKSAFTAFLVITSSSASIAATNDAAKNTTEKCYGIVRAGMNDCATAKQSCAGSATKDKQSDAFVFVPTGLCNKIVGGMLKPKDAAKT